MPQIDKHLWDPTWTCTEPACDRCDDVAFIHPQPGDHDYTTAQ